MQRTLLCNLNLASPAHTVTSANSSLWNRLQVVSEGLRCGRCFRSVYLSIVAVTASSAILLTGSNEYLSTVVSAEADQMKLQRESQQRARGSCCLNALLRVQNAEVACRKSRSGTEAASRSCLLNSAPFTSPTHKSINPTPVPFHPFNNSPISPFPSLSAYSTAVFPSAFLKPKSHLPVSNNNLTISPLPFLTAQCIGEYPLSLFEFTFAPAFNISFTHSVFIFQHATINAVSPFADASSILHFCDNMNSKHFG